MLRKRQQKYVEFLFPLPFIHSFVNAGLNILYSTQRIKMLGKFTCKGFS